MNDVMDETQSIRRGHPRVSFFLRLTGCKERKARLGTLRPLSIVGESSIGSDAGKRS